MTTRQFTVQELAALGVPPDSPEDVQWSETVLLDEAVGTLKYSVNRRCIFRDEEGTTWAVTYEGPVDAGDYEVGPPPDDRGWSGGTVEAVQVQQRPVLVARWEPVPENHHLEERPRRGAIESLTEICQDAGSGPTPQEAAVAWIIEHADEVVDLADEYASSAAGDL